jgi:hypothetical protein
VRGWAKKLRGAAPAVLFFAAASIVMTFPLVLHLSDHVSGDARDPYYTMWVLSSNYRAAAGQGSFWTGNIFFPHTGTLYYGDPLFGLTLLGAPVRLFTDNPVLIYNILYLFSFFLSGFGLYALVRRLTKSGSAAVLAGFLFAYFPYSAAHISHLEILYYGWIPIVLLFMHRFFEKPSWGNVGGMAGTYVMLVLTCVYYGEFFSLFAAAFAVYYAWRTGYWRTRRFWIRSAGFIALSAAVLIPYALPFLKLHERMLFVRPLWEIRFFSAQIQHYLAVPFSNRLWGSILGGPGGDELKLYLGLVPTGLFLYFWIRARRENKPLLPAPTTADPHPKHHWILWDALNFVIFLWIFLLAVNPRFRGNVFGLTVTAQRLEDPVLVLIVSLALRIGLDPPVRNRYAQAIRSIGSDAKFYTLAALSAFLLSFGPEIRVFGQRLIAGPYTFLYRMIPGFRNLRVPARFGVLAMLGFLVVGAFAVSGILSRLNPRKRVWVFGLLLAVGAADFISVPLPLTAVATAKNLPAIYETVARLPAGAALIELPMPLRDNEEFNDAEAVYYSSFHRRPIVNGYSGAAPPGYRIIREAMRDFPARRPFDLLDNLDVQYVLVHASGRHAAQGAEMLGRMPHYLDRAAFVAAAGGDVLYRLLPAAPERREPAAPALKPVGDKKLWKGETGRGRLFLRAAFDGNPATFWTTGFPQSKGDYFQIDLGRVERFREIALRLQDNPLDFPRNFDIRLSLDGTNWTLLNRVMGFFPMLTRATIEDFSTYRAVLSTIPAETRFIRIRLIESHPYRHWSIAEFDLRGD